MITFISIISDDDVLFDEIYNKYYPYAFKICHSRIKDCHVVEEILNISFYKIYKHLDTTLPEKAIKAFIAKVVSNDTSNYLKSISKQPQHEEFCEDCNLNFEEWSNFPLERMIVAEGINMIYNEISKLSPKISETMSLLISGRLSKKEIAEILGIPLKTVYSRIEAGRKQLKSKLTKVGTYNRSLKGDE